MKHAFLLAVLILAAAVAVAEGGRRLLVERERQAVARDVLDLAVRNVEANPDLARRAALNAREVLPDDPRVAAVLARLGIGPPPSPLQSTTPIRDGGQ